MASLFMLAVLYLPDVRCLAASMWDRPMMPARAIPHDPPSQAGDAGGPGSAPARRIRARPAS